MEIILKEDIIGLGYKNDIVDVKSGYGRNYLIPTGKAVIASDSAKKMLAEVALTIPTKVSATGVIYGSVNSLQIADELNKLGFDIDRKIIVVKDVKEVGSYHATVKLHKEVSVEIPFEVVAEEA